MIAKISSKSNLIIVECKNGQIEPFTELKLSIGSDLINSENTLSFSVKHSDYLLYRLFFQNKFKNYEIDYDDSFKQKFIDGLKTGMYNAENINKISREEFLDSIKGLFKRKLKEFQLKNVLKLLKFKSGATFSVPGAGKTSEILSVFSYYLSKSKSLKMLVICPKNAVSAWTEQLGECFDNPSQFNKGIKDKNKNDFTGMFALLSDGKENVEFILNQNPELMIVTFQSNVNYENLISTYISRNELMCVVDESHKIKSLNGVTSNSVLNYSTICKHKFIMSGTPMPQSEEDLKSQYGFLFPESLCLNDYYQKIKSIYVRTTKNDLGLKQPIFHEIKVEMSIEHQELYEKVKNWYKENIGSLTDMYTLRKLKGCVMYLLQLTSNPMIVSNDEFLETVRNLGLENVLHEYSTKFNLVIDKVRELTSKNEKVLIWTSFTKNIDLLERELIDLNPVIIDGRVEVGESEEIGTRKGNIEKFKNDPTCMVFIANPAAASEGMSLHIDNYGNKLCSKAIYLDRNFNCSQYLQSIDRIHRLGSIESPEIFIYKTINSIDYKVQSRLDEKVDAMRTLLNDKSLSPYISNDSYYPNEEIDIESDDEKSFYLDCLNN